MPITLPRGKERSTFRAASVVQPSASMTIPAVRYLAAGVAAAAGLGAYATLVEPRWLQTTRVDIHVRGLHPAFEGLTIGLLSDLHAGGGTPHSVLKHACARVMESSPDLVAVTGDLVSRRGARFDVATDALSGLRAPLGVYAVPGNHDHDAGIERWRRAVASAGVRDLTNGAVTHRVGGARLCVAGVDDLSEGDPRLILPDPDARDLTVLLAHNPEQAERARRGEDEVDLVLSGHTHGGQVRLPSLGALKSPLEHGLQELYDEGLRRRPWTQVYVSRGVGTSSLPVRFLCRPEVALLRLTSAKRPGRSRR
jgi:uncharacterized protein